MTVRFLIALGLIGCGAASAQTPVFVNEVHYDNVSTDFNETIEVAGPAGTDLSGFSLVLYSGSGGDVYATLALSGSLTDQCGGYGTRAVAAPGLQNGAPDGFALVDNAGIVLQFLSYEGSFTGSDGPAAGLVSTDIGVSEGNGTAATASLALTGNGSDYEDFAWAVAGTASFGACNPQQTFTGGVDNAPVVMAVSPADGATGVGTGSLLTVTFSEPVDAPPSAFTLSCGGAGQSLAVSGGPVRFTLDPATDLPEETSCSLAITGTLVRDRDGTPDPMSADFTSGFTTGIGSGDYYSGVDAGSPASLRTTLHTVIKDHTRYPYTDDVEIDTWDILEQADEDPLDPARILDVYRNATYGKVGGGNNNYNREHTWPNSLGFPNNVPENSAYTDTHMLMLSDIGHNSARGNLAFGNCTSGESFATLVYFGQGGPGHANLRCGSYWHVWDALRGNVARAILYMDIRFEGGSHGITGAPEPDLRLTDNPALIASSGGVNASVAYMGLLATLLQWHAEDPPDERERLRNGIVQSYQGNRNPFVDHPEWAACIHLAQCAASLEIIFGDSFE